MNNLLSFFILTESNLGLPLAIAANLHVSYRIEIGIENIEYFNVKDKSGKGKKKPFHSINLANN